MVHICVTWTKRERERERERRGKRDRKLHKYARGPVMVDDNTGRGGEGTGGDREKAIGKGIR